MQESGRTQDFVSTVFPPITNKSSTGCWPGRPRRRATALPGGTKRYPTLVLRNRFSRALKARGRPASKGPCGDTGTSPVV